ncbi:flagellar hook-basal body complex protein FliE [Desulfocurvus sp.]|jgi:flagellar hook-basal body complex protein FliE|uniref:flagellar hook-basal body complex protein FliE n=1 Tax=Desulfocurvus sp. TaxID=2871698 RepID=UPI0025C4F5B9|nr:flagellar hook-basal body complex protein FliE [Desulfocurvus sp.]MCK9240723.1 flagellar hook-basal body complex protein FliE [Desulfocurvus sp.]
MAIRNVAMNAYQNAQLTGGLRRTGSGQATFITDEARKSQKSTFTDTMRDSLSKVNELQSEKSGMVEEFASGERQNVHELMISLQKAGLAMRMTSAVRNKVLEAYKELSRMQF